jgi:hypothetical protein
VVSSAYYSACSFALARRVGDLSRVGRPARQGDGGPSNTAGMTSLANDSAPHTSAVQLAVASSVDTVTLR